ncbi:hypothetical protein MHYP_G00151870 [Metynnis hypsauchen]
MDIIETRRVELNRAQLNQSRVYNPYSSTAVYSQARPGSYDSPANHSSGGGACLNTGGETTPYLLPGSFLTPAGTTGKGRERSSARARACFGDLRAVSASRDLGALFREAKRERRRKWKHVDEL